MPGLVTEKLDVVREGSAMLAKDEKIELHHTTELLRQGQLLKEEVVSSESRLSALAKARDDAVGAAAELRRQLRTL